jgi:hypothetical protein
LWFTLDAATDTPQDGLHYLFIWWPAIGGAAFGLFCGYMLGPVLN